jgi:ubiquitin C-terminal hydrolase
MSEKNISLLENLDNEKEENEKSNFIGLNNQGATCYLNSLLQTL